MPLKIYRLRRLLAATAVLLTLVVAGMYFYARMRATNFVKTFPGKIGIEIKQTASGYQYSQSNGKRTLFTIQASNVKEFKLNGDAELHNVSIILYGRDSSRFDQIYGDDFAYNEKTGDVTAKGDVQIDLVANPAGLASPDQSTPKELKNPIHLKTRDLVFNKNSGNAVTDARVEFRTPQAKGWAVGVTYAGKSNTLTLSSQIHVVLNGPDAAVIEAEHGVITNDPHQIVLDHPHLTRDDGTLQADRAVFYLGRENQVERVLASGNVSTVTRMQDAKRSGAAPATAFVAGNPAGNPVEPRPPSEMRSRADQAEFLLAGKQNLLRTATMTGSVHVEQSGPQPMQGDAGRVVMDFAGQNQLQRVHALDGVRMTQKAAAENNPGSNAGNKPGNKPAGKGPGTGPQDFELTAPIINFTVAEGHILKQAVTSGAAQITIAGSPATTQPQARTVSRPTNSSPTNHGRDGRHVPGAVRLLRRPDPPHQPPRRARRTHRQLGSRTARPRQHQRLGRCRLPATRRHRLHHPTRQRRLYRWPAARKAHASLGQLRALHPRGSDAAADRKSAHNQRRHGDHCQDHSHQPRHWRGAGPGRRQEHL